MFNTLNQQISILRNDVEDLQIDKQEKLNTTIDISLNSLYLKGNLIVDGSFNIQNIIQNDITINNEILISTQLDISNEGTGPALKVSQLGNGSDKHVALFNAGEEGDSLLIDSSGNIIVYKKLVVDGDASFNAFVDISNGLNVVGPTTITTLVSNIITTDNLLVGTSDICMNYALNVNGGVRLYSNDNNTLNSIEIIDEWTIRLNLSGDYFIHYPNQVVIGDKTLIEDDSKLYVNGIIKADGLNVNGGVRFYNNEIDTLNSMEIDVWLTRLKISGEDFIYYPNQVVIGTDTTIDDDSKLYVNGKITTDSLNVNGGVRFYNNGIDTLNSIEIDVWLTRINISGEDFVYYPNKVVIGSETTLEDDSKLYVNGKITADNLSLSSDLNCNTLNTNTLIINDVNVNETFASKQDNLNTTFDISLNSLYLKGNLIVDGSFNIQNLIQNDITINNEILISTQLDISNEGTGPALKVSQLGNGSDKHVALFNAGEEGDSLLIDSSGNTIVYKKLVVDGDTSFNAFVDISNGLNVAGPTTTTTLVSNTLNTNHLLVGTSDVCMNYVMNVEGGVRLYSNDNNTLNSIEIVDEWSTGKNILGEDFIYYPNQVIIGGTTEIDVTDSKLYVNGTITAEILNLTSDKRLKDNIEDISHSLSILRQLYPKKYNKGANIEFGFIANDVLNINDISFVVSTSNTYYSLNYNSLFSLSIQAIKELDAEVDQLKTKNDELEQRLEALEHFIYKNM